MIDQFPGGEDDQLRPSAGRHDIEPVETHQELVFILNSILVSHGVRCDYHVALLPLEAFNGVHGIADQAGRYAKGSEGLLEPGDDEGLLGPVGSDNPDTFPPEFLHGVRCAGRWDDRAGNGVPFVQDPVGQAPVQQEDEGGNRGRLEWLHLPS